MLLIRQRTHFFATSNYTSVSWANTVRMVITNMYLWVSTLVGKKGDKGAVVLCHVRFGIKSIYHLFAY